MCAWSFFFALLYLEVSYFPPDFLLLASRASLRIAWRGVHSG